MTEQFYFYVYAQENCKHMSTQKLYRNACNNIIYNCPKMEMTQIYLSIDEWINKM